MPPRPDPPFDRELEDLPPELRWREWMRRIEAVLFASSAPVAREDLATDLADRPYVLVRAASGWALRTRPAYAAAIRVAADVADQELPLSEFDLAVLAAIAWHQPITRDGLAEFFGREIGRNLIGRLSDRGLITTGPRAPRRGAPYTFVTTESFLATFGLESLRDLAGGEQLADAGLTGP